MKTILVDAIYCFVSDRAEIFEAMNELLEMYPNKKILVTGADDRQFEEWGLANMPYPVFSLKHHPEKTDPKYFETLLLQYKLNREEVIYFEHNPEAVKSAESVGIKSYHYDDDKKDLVALKKFLDEEL